MVLLNLVPIRMGSLNAFPGPYQFVWWCILLAPYEASDEFTKHDVPGTDRKLLKPIHRHAKAGFRDEYQRVGYIRVVVMEGFNDKWLC